MASKPAANARPTKSLIIEALTTDIELLDAILDLVDNSVDGIRRKDKSNPKWDDYSIAVTFSEKEFVITDNCNGIDAGVARDYAFRFGRPADRAPEHGLLGMYGVGMKRAIFKIGEQFEVLSATASSHFQIKQNLKTWKANEGLWSFEFQEFDETANGGQPIGTTIRITRLAEGVSQEFKSPQFESELIKKAAKAHRSALAKGLRLKVKDTPLQTASLSLLNSDAIRPAFSEVEFNGDAEPVQTTIYAGVSESRPKEAGWYVFCNGRLVLEADQTAKTVWGGEIEEVSIPRIHNQFSRFRGYVFFDCDDQKKLPWTSTKSSINTSSHVYRQVRRKMIETTRPVITFLNELDKEKDADERPRHDAINAAKEIALSDIPRRPVAFRYDGKVVTGPPIARISFQRPKERVDRVKEALDVGSNKEVGEQVFDYFYRYEIGKK